MQSDPITRTYYGFENQFMKLYTKVVFKEFPVKLNKSTLFRIKQNPDYPELDEYNYLVTFHSPTDQFAWSAHEFKVVADTTKGEYRCECLLWEHTGTPFLAQITFLNFFVHLI